MKLVQRVEVLCSPVWKWTARMSSLVAGGLPLLALAWGFSKAKGDLFQVLAIGAYLTAKIGVTAGYTYRQSRIANPGGGDYNDKLQVASLGASWAIARAWQLGCNLSHEKRDAGGAAGLAYSANVIGCSAQFTLR